MPRLQYTVDNVVIREYELNAEQLNIGRGADSDIRLDDGAVSQRHASLRIRPSAYMEGRVDVWLEDLGSTNGTRINGRPILRHLLKDGDKIEIGGHHFCYVDELGAGAETTRLMLDDEAG